MTHINLNQVQSKNKISTIKLFKMCIKSSTGNFYVLTIFVLFQVFEYLDEAILSTDLVAKEEYYQRRIHTLITDFIVLMHSKLMEMRVK